MKKQSAALTIEARGIPYSNQLSKSMRSEMYTGFYARARTKVAKTTIRDYEKWENTLNTAEGRNNIFRIGRQLMKDKQDALGIYC